MIITDENIIFDAWKRLNSKQWSIWWCFNIAEAEIVDENILQYISKKLGYSYKEVWNELFQLTKKSNYLIKQDDGKYHFYLQEPTPYVNLEDLITETAHKEHPDFERMVCIYGIYVNDICVYVGQTINLLQRYIQHGIEILCPRNSKAKKYQLLEELYKQNYNISIKPIEILYNNLLLDDKEQYYINLYNPSLNSQLPTDNPNKKFKIRSLKDVTVNDIINEINEKRRINSNVK